MTHPRRLCGRTGSSLGWPGVALPWRIEHEGHAGFDQTRAHLPNGWLLLLLRLRRRRPLLALRPLHSERHTLHCGFHSPLHIRHSPFAMLFAIDLPFAIRIRNMRRALSMPFTIGFTKYKKSETRLVVRRCFSLKERNGHENGLRLADQQSRRKQTMGGVRFRYENPIEKKHASRKIST